MKKMIFFLKAMHPIGQSQHSCGFAVVVVYATQEQRIFPLRGVSHTVTSRTFVCRKCRCRPSGRSAILRGHPLTPGRNMKKKEGMLLSKRKEPPRIAIRVTDKEKETIFRLAEKCGLSASEYARQRALGYEPRAVLPDAFFIFCEKLDKLTEAPFSTEVNKAALKLIRDMSAVLISPGKEDMKLWQQQDSGPSEES